MVVVRRVLMPGSMKIGVGDTETLKVIGALV